MYSIRASLGASLMVRYMKSQHRSVTPKHSVFMVNIVQGEIPWVRALPEVHLQYSPTPPTIEHLPIDTCRGCHGNAEMLMAAGGSLEGGSVRILPATLHHCSKRCQLSLIGCLVVMETAGGGGVVLGGGCIKDGVLWRHLAGGG